MGASPCRPGLALQLIEKPQDPRDVRAAIEEVTEEYHVSPSPDPLALRVDEPGVSQETENPVELSVHVSHDEEGIHISEDSGGASQLLVEIQNRFVEILGRQGTVSQEHRISTWTGKCSEVRLPKRSLDAVDRAILGDNLKDPLLGAGCEPPHPDRAPAICYPESILAFELHLGASHR